MGPAPDRVICALVGLSIRLNQRTDIDGPGQGAYGK